MSLGGLVLLYIGEILPAAGVSIATLVIWLSGFAITQVFLDLKEAIGLNVIFFILVGFNFVSLIILYFFMIESKGKSKGQIILEFASKTDAKFMKELEEAKKPAEVVIVSPETDIASPEN